MGCFFKIGMFTLSDLRVCECSWVSSQTDSSEVCFNLKLVLLYAFSNLLDLDNITKYSV